jgi:peptidoglycan L-alanyl-D-glutamate endopeptidase CwlK
MQDNLTIDRIYKAHPKIKEELLSLYLQCNNMLPKNVRLRFSYVFRSPEEQHALFLKRPKVTNADSWQSIHNYGLAFDIVLLYDKNGDGTFETASWDNDKNWQMVVVFFKSKGYEWGGDWKKFKDAPHFQKDFGFDWKVLKQRIDKGITIVENGITYPKI